MTNPFIAITFGIVIGFAAGVPMQASLNEVASTKCKGHTTTHQLVSTRGFWGTSKFCVDLATAARRLRLNRAVHGWQFSFRLRRKSSSNGLDLVDLPFAFSN
jgi:hypothetical protein